MKNVNSKKYNIYIKYYTMSITTNFTAGSLGDLGSIFVQTKSSANKIITYVPSTVDVYGQRFTYIFDISLNSIGYYLIDIYSSVHTTGNANTDNYNISLVLSTKSQPSTTTSSQYIIPKGVDFSSPFFPACANDLYNGFPSHSMGLFYNGTSDATYNIYTYNAGVDEFYLDVNVSAIYLGNNII